MKTAEKVSYTPGPWFVNEIGVVTYFDREYERDCQVCRVPDIEDATQAANARLIAAAPEMAEALRFALVTLDTLTSEQYQYGGDREARIRMAEALRKAGIEL